MMQGEDDRTVVADNVTGDNAEVPSVIYPDPNEMVGTIGHLKDLGVQVSTVRRALSEYRRAWDEEGKDLDRPFHKVKEGIEKGWASWAAKRLDLDITLARMSLSALRSKGRSVEDLTNRLEAIDIKDPRKASDGRNAIFAIRGDLTGAFEGGTDHILPEAWTALDRALDSYEEIAKVPDKVAKVKRLFKKVLQSVSKEDINNTLVYSKTLQTEIQKLLSDEIAKDRFKAIKDEVKGLMQLMEEYRKFGLETDVIGSDISLIDKSLESGKVIEAQTLMNRMSKNISRTEKELNRRKGTVNILEAMDLVDEYGSLLDLSEERAMLVTLVDEQGAMPPKRFVDESGAVLERVKDTLFKNLQGQVTERLENLERSLVGLDSVSEDSRQELVDLRRSIDESLKDRNITEAMEYLSLAESSFGQSEGEIRLQEIKNSYSRFLEEYEMLLSEDMETMEVREKLEELERMFMSDEANPEDLSAKVYEASVMVQDQIVDLRKKAFGKERDALIKMMDSLSFSGGVRNRMEGRLERLGTMVGTVEENAFRSDLAKFRTDLESEIKGYVKENYQDWAQRVKGEIEGLSSTDLDLSSLYPRMDEANRLYDSGDMLGAGEVMRELEQDVLRMEDDLELRRTEELISSAEFMFEEAGRAGVDVEAHRGTLLRAKELISSGDLEGANRLAKEVEDSVKGSWMDMKRVRLESEMKGLRSYMEDSTTLGLDITDATSLLHEAEFMFNEHKLDQVSELVGRARDDIDGKRSAFFSDSAMGTINKLKEEIATLGQIGIDNLEAETMLIEAERLFMNEDYEKAYSLTLNIREHLNESRDSYLSDLVPRELREIKQKMDRLEGLGLDTSSIKDMVQSVEGSQNSGALLESLESLRKAREVSDELFRSHISLAIPETIGDVRKQIEEAMEEGMDLTEVNDLLGNAEELFRVEQYDMAMEAVERAQDTFQNVRKDFFKGKYLENMETVEGMVDKASGMDMEMDLSRANMNMARDAYERGDFEASHTLMEKVIKFLERSMDEKSLTKKRETVQTYFDEVRTLLMVAEGENIDVGGERSMFRIVEELMAKGDYDQAEHVLEGIKLGINEKRLTMKRKVIERSIQTTDILLQNMNEMGIDTSSEKELIGQLKEALRQNDLELCDEINLKLINTMKRNEGPYSVQKVQRELSELRSSIVDANSMGLDTNVLKDYLSDAIELFENNDLEGAQRVIVEGKAAVTALHEEHETNEFNKALGGLRSQLEKLVSLGIPIEDEEALISSAQENVASKEIESAMSLLMTAGMGAEAKLNSYQQTTSEGYIQQIPAYLEELRGQGIDTSDLAGLFNDGISDHGAGDYDKAVNKFVSILELGQEMRKLHGLSLLRRAFTMHEQRYAELKEVGMKPSKKLDEAFRSAKAIIMRDSVEVSNVEQIVRKLDHHLKKKSEPFLKELARKHIAEARMALKESGATGEDQRLVSKLKEAAKAFGSEDHGTAEKIALELIDELERVKMVETEQVLKREITSVKKVLLRLKTLGSNVSKAEKLISRSEAALGSGRMESAESLITAVKDAVNEVVTRNMRETALETMEFVEALVKYLTENFSGVSGHLGPANDLVKEARVKFRERAFKESKQKAEEARNFIERSELQNIEQFLFVFRSMQAEEISKAVRNRINELAQKGLDVTKVNMLYDKAQEHFGREEYEKGRQMITFARVMMSEMDQQSLRDSAVEELNAAHLGILAMKKDGLEVDNAYRLYNNAKEAFTTGEFKKAILLAKKSSLRPKK